MSNTTDKGVYTIVSKDDIEIAASILRHQLSDFAVYDDVDNFLDTLGKHNDLYVIEHANVGDYCEPGKFSSYIYVYEGKYGVVAEKYAKEKAYGFSKRVTPKEHLEALDEALRG